MFSCFPPLSIHLQAACYNGDAAVAATRLRAEGLASDTRSALRRGDGRRRGGVLVA